MGEDQRLAALAAAINRVLDEAALAENLAAAGRRRYEAEFTEEAGAKRYLAFYESLLDTQSAAAQ